MICYMCAKTYNTTNIFIAGMKKKELQLIAVLSALKICIECITLENSEICIQNLEA